MKYLRFVIPIFLFFTLTSNAQNAPYERSKLPCEDTTYMERRPPWNIDIDEGCKSDFYRNNFTEISDKHFDVIENIESKIIERGGEEFYKKLTLDAINITKVKSKECGGIAYILRYVFTIDEAFNYRFELYFDENGNPMKDQAFPSVKSDPDFMKLVDPCTLIDPAIEDEEFDKFYAPTTKKMVHHVALEYDTLGGKFVFAVYGKDMYRDKIPAGSTFIKGYFYGRKVYFDAKTGVKIRTDRTKVWKSVRLM